LAWLGLHIFALEGRLVAPNILDCTNSLNFYLVVMADVKVNLVNDQDKARATLETGCPHTVLSQEHGQGETPQGKTVLS